ncbi:uncharacterized protein LOC128035341 [Gossypium raimondii]|uniref:uncharacterized protein LOC128035341 n=1 Tax=Gossypium raimondii TaxID=29730 RepID=UPI002279F560|nr:uncharacterized protein LOC128035341 [Gossypium raimondii]
MSRVGQADDDHNDVHDKFKMIQQQLDEWAAILRTLSATINEMQVEKRAQRGQLNSSERAEIRVPRRRTSNEYSRRDSYHDSYSMRNSRRCKVPEIPKDNFQLQYLSNERCFHTINIGKDEITLHEPKGKRGKEILATESRAVLKIIDKTFGDLFLKRSHHFDPINCYSLIVVDKVITKGSVSCYSLIYQV